MWQDMLRRCYKNDNRIQNINYLDCIVCNEWLFYENFYEWVHSQENYKNILKLNKSAIDKDIIQKHNKIYSPQYCCLVPSYINNIFTRRERERGNLPIGVSYHYRKSNTYIAGFTKYGKRYHIGVFDNPIDAFYAYKYEKESYIKEVAKEEYEKGNIIEKCYEAMINYKVEITD